MKKLYVLLFAFLAAVSIYAQQNQESGPKFEAQFKVGPGFLSYGDIWGMDRGVAMQYGSKWFVRFEYSYSNYETSFYNQEFYRDTEGLTTQTKYQGNFFGPSAAAEHEFGFKLLDVKDIINTINSYQLALGRRIYLFKDIFSFNIKGNLGIYKLTSISPSIIIQTVTVSNSFYYMEDITLIGTFTNSFLDVNWGFGTEFEYEILPNRLSLNLYTNASLGDARFFSFGLGSSIKI